MAKKIVSLVTGGAGFIGSHTVDALIAKGHHVVVVDNFSSGHKKNVNPKAKVYSISVVDARALHDIFKKEKPQYVVHLAAQKDVRASVSDPAFDASENIIGGINVLEACVAAKVKKIVFASTGGAIYGETKNIPTSEPEPCRPISPYGIAKLTVEHYLYYYKHTYGLQYAVLRYANVYGPRQDPYGEAGVVAIFSAKLLSGETPLINGTGKQTRDYVYVGDVVAANIRALAGNKSGIWNIGTGKETDVNELYTAIASAVGSTKRAKHGPAKSGEQMRSAVHISKARRELGWRPRYALAKGIKETVRWFQ